MGSTPPRIIANRYVLVRGSEVEGGLSTVARATDSMDDGRTVAIKILGRPRIASDLLPVAFRRETAALRALDHPNIVRLLDSGQDPTTGEYYLVLEWLPQRLDSILIDRQQGPDRLAPLHRRWRRILP